MAQAQSTTAMITSLATLSEDDKDGELLWMTQMIETIRNLKDNPSRDCLVIVGETKIPVHKVVVELNSSLLTAGRVGSDEPNEVTEIEVAPEFDDQSGLVESIVTSFYSGTIEIDEGVMKQVYKFSVLYEVGWLKILSRRSIVNYLTKSVFKCYQRFTEIFTFAHFIWDTDLFEGCIKVMDDYIMALLIEDVDMLEKISYRCMEIITVSPNVGFTEMNLFRLLVAWVACKGQTCKKSFQRLFENLKYESMDKEFIISRVMLYVSQNEDIFSVTFLQKIMGGMTESSQDICRSNHNEQLKEDALKRVKILLPCLDCHREYRRDDSDYHRIREETMTAVNTFLIGRDIRYLSDEMKEELVTQLDRWSLSGLVLELDWLSVVNLVNHYDNDNTTSMFARHIESKLDKQSEYHTLDWTIVTDKTILRVLKVFTGFTTDSSTDHYCSNTDSSTVEIAMTWCLANRGTCNDATLERIISQICFEYTGDVYNSNILLPTIKHLLPNTTNLECHHSDECESHRFDFKLVPVNEKLYKLEPFEDDVATLTDYNGVLQLEWREDMVGCGLGCMFIKDKPYEPFFPVFGTAAVDDGILKRFIASLKDGDEINIIMIGE